MIARSAALALMLMAFCVAALAEAQDNANPPLAELPLAETIFTPSGIPAESPFASFQEQEAIIGQNLEWLGVNSDPVSVTAAIQEDGTILITAASFVVRLSADGQIVERREPGKRIVGMIAPYNVAARPLGLVQQNIDSFSFAANGTPLPKDGLVDEVRKAREACLIVAEERIREAQLIEAVTGRDDPLVHGEIGGYLLERGVDPMALDSEIIRFRQWAHQKRGAWERRQERKWNRLIREDVFIGPPEPGERAKGQAETMGEVAGPYLFTGAADAALLYAGRNPITIGAAGVARKFGEQYAAPAGGGYGRYVDEMGDNVFIPTLMGPSPRPGKSMLDSMRDAWNRLFPDE